MNSAWHSLSGAQTLEKLGSNERAGLTEEQAAAALIKFGDNRLREAKKKTLLQRFFDQFKDAMILILIAAAIISFIVALGGQDANEFFEPLLIVLIVVLNAVLGVVQESKAEKSLEALQSLSAPHARVVRSGKEQVIDAVGLVPGDVVLVEAGDFVPADARLLEAASLKSEESALTGESVPSEKTAALALPQTAPVGDRRNMLHAGCSVSYGRARAVVVETGMNTQMGQIADLLEGEQDSSTPLQQKLQKLGRTLGILALVICGAIFVLGMLDGMPILEIFMTAVSLAVSAIPEGLPAIVTIVLSMGVQRMVKRGAIIRRLPAVETLGSASVICSDKTGTLTQNRMTLVKAYDASSWDVQEISDHNSENINSILRFAVLCCDGSVVFEDGKERHIGDPTETSIVMAAHKNGMEKEALNEMFPRLAEIPFDSDRKLMSTINRIGDKLYVIVKGAYDSLAPRCVGDLQRATGKVDEMSAQALRVLGVAVKEIDKVPQKLESDDLENSLTLIGLVGMIDPPREEARTAVQICRAAGIQPVMITGDHVVTASAIAKALGIMKEGDQAVTGAQLEKMSEPELAERVRHISVYARVSPQDKIRIVKAWQAQGEVVSMTGDGVNDAPALKAADIGCAMGITGTDVAKGAADMTLTDDNFATIVEAVREGRGIYDNIRHAVAFLLGTNVGEVLTVLFAMLIWRTSPLLSMQLLWINLVTDSLPAIALGLEPVQDEVMERKPMRKDEGIFAHGLGVRIVLQGAMFALLTLFAFHLGQSAEGLGGGRTMAFIVLALSQIFHSYNMRSPRSLSHTGVFTNKYLNGAALLSLILMTLVVFIPPVANAFGLVALPGISYLIALGLSLVPIVVLEISKAMGLISHHHPKSDE